MVEDGRTKDVFRELDGFLVLVSMLSTLPLPPAVEGEEEDPTERLETVRLAFAVVGEAMRDHERNRDHFEVRPCSSSNGTCP